MRMAVVWLPVAVSTMGAVGVATSMADSNPVVVTETTTTVSETTTTGPTVVAETTTSALDTTGPAVASSAPGVDSSVSVTPSPEAGSPVAGTFRVATFNASLNRAAEGELVADLSTPGDAQAAAVAEVIQHIRPDILLINEFDYVDGGEAVELFRDNYLAVSQQGADPIDYTYFFIAPSNTGVDSGFDLNNDGTVGGRSEEHTSELQSLRQLVC